MDNKVISKNNTLRQRGFAPLCSEEAIGTRLYTGPMYHKYNTVMRAKLYSKNLAERDSAAKAPPSPPPCIPPITVVVPHTIYENS